LSVTTTQIEGEKEKLMKDEGKKEKGAEDESWVWLCGSSALIPAFMDEGGTGCFWIHLHGQQQMHS